MISAPLNASLVPPWQNASGKRGITNMNERNVYYIINGIKQNIAVIIAIAEEAQSRNESLSTNNLSLLAPNRIARVAMALNFIIFGKRSPNSRSRLYLDSSGRKSKVYKNCDWVQ